MEKTEMMREEIKRRIHEVENELKALKELVDSDAFAPIKEIELTEFEKELAGIICQWGDSEETKISKYVLKYSPKLLELAKNEICKGCTVGLDQYWKGREDAKKEYEKPYTYYYPIFHQPCHHGGICTNPMRDCINCPMHSSGTTTNTTSETCKKD